MGNLSAVAIAIRYYLARRRIATSFPLAKRRTSLGLVIRISLFNAYLFVAFGCVPLLWIFAPSLLIRHFCRASIVFLTGKLHPWPYMVQAACKSAAVVLDIYNDHLVKYLSWPFYCLRRRRWDLSFSFSYNQRLKNELKTVILAWCFWRKKTKSYSTDSMPEIRRTEMVIDDLDMSIVTPKTGPEVV